jgi:hypothetical protein
MNKIRMLITQRGVHDGAIHPVTFVEGEEYEIGGDLLQSFIDLGAVELVEDRGEKSQGDSPANTARKAAPENKSR